LREAKTFGSLKNWLIAGRLLADTPGHIGRSRLQAALTADTVDG